MFHRPENTKVDESDIDLFIARVIIIGSRVPRSPKDPEISERGDLRKVETLLALTARILVRNIAKDDMLMVLLRIYRGAKDGYHSTNGSLDHREGKEQIYGAESRTLLHSCGACVASLDADADWRGGCDIINIAGGSSFAS